MLFALHNVFPPRYNDHLVTTSGQETATVSFIRWVVLKWLIVFVVVFCLRGDVQTDRGWDCMNTPSRLRCQARGAIPNSFPGLVFVNSNGRVGGGGQQSGWPSPSSLGVVRPPSLPPPTHTRRDTHSHTLTRLSASAAAAAPVALSCCCCSLCSSRSSIRQRIGQF